jgi:hypothetical protein
MMKNLAIVFIGGVLAYGMYVAWNDQRPELFLVLIAWVGSMALFCTGGRK